MKYWIMKTEPEAFSWERLRKEKKTHWDGVRNFQAQNYMKQMKVGDIVFIYHSVTEKAIVGIAEVSKEFHPDHTDETGRFGMVDVKYKSEIKRPMTLAEIKAEPKLANLLLIRQSRLSVIPVSIEEWKVISNKVL